MNQDEKRKLETRLVAMGLNGMDDPEMGSMFAAIVEDFPGDRHWFFRGLINECEPSKRRDMYYTLKPRFTRFEPLSLETYLAQIAEDAGRMVSHGILRVEGRRPDAIKIGDEYFVDAKGKQPSHIAVRLTCSKCTKQRSFVGETYFDAVVKARKKGWVFDVSTEKDICPKCPALREGTKVGRA